MGTMSGHMRGVRHFAVVLLAATLAVPASVAAIAMEAVHEQCEVMRHDCGEPLLKVCCCRVEQSNQPVPASPPAGRTTLASFDATSCPPPVFLTVPAAVVGTPAGAPWLHAPPHGYRSTDLSVLLSVFLI